jgi:hypothetical protein
VGPTALAVGPTIRVRAPMQPARPKIRRHLTLNLVSRLASADLAKHVAEHLEFSWSD